MVRKSANGVPMSQSNEPVNVLEELLTARHSCRAFRSDPVPQATIERILSLAQKTASWCNSQPWKVLITSGYETKRFRDSLYKTVTGGAAQEGDFPFPREYGGVYGDRRRESGFQLYSALGIDRGDKAAYQKQGLENFNLFGAPHVAIVTTDEALGVYGAVDCGAYVANFLLAAQALGVAAVPQAALAHYAHAIRRHFALGDDRRMVCGISFGYEDKEHPANGFRTARAELREVATFAGM
jgi:nitroreductase